MAEKAPIGIFDSGYGGLTVLDEIRKSLPGYDFIYLGDNARNPYGTRSFDVVLQFTLEGVKKLFEMGSQLIILACNTASAKALRNIQQKFLPYYFPDKRVLGVLRPTTEIIGDITKTKNIGILGTTGTVLSNSYVIEIGHFFPQVKVYQQACPLWVPLIENNEHQSNGADYFVKKYIDELFTQNNNIDTILLACTHYPLLMEKIKKYVNSGINIISQGPIVANSLVDYLKRHPEIDEKCSQNNTIHFHTTDSTEVFDKHATVFFNEIIFSEHIEIK